MDNWASYNIETIAGVNYSKMITTWKTYTNQYYQLSQFVVAG